MAPRNTEEQVYRAVAMGELEIDGNGNIWRVATRRGNRWAGGTVSTSHRKQRAEHDNGHYLMVRTMIDKTRYHALAHRLVWLHFNGPIPSGLTINHKNGDKKDNRPSNLELATYSEQVIHSLHVLKRGRDQRGERNSMVKLTESQVREIRELRKAGLKLAEIGNRYGVTFQAISKIVRGQRRQSLG